MQLAACGALIDLVTTKVASNLTRENVIDEMFCGPPLCVPFSVLIHYIANNGTSPANVIERGVEIIWTNRCNGRIRSQLQKALESAASGENPGKLSACFSGPSLHQGNSHSLGSEPTEDRIKKHDFRSFM